MQPLVGTRLGPYEILAPIGAGGMGEVYRARDTRLGRDVAVKVLPSELAADPAALARFDREARAVAAINHPNILALHDIGTHNGIAHAVMELLEGDTLRERLTNSPPPPRRAIEWASQLARGLAAAHDRGVVHRDLKPENVFVTRDGRIKILDFGIARRVQAPDGSADGTMTTMTERGLFVGTPAYASPEQVVGEPATASSDLFSFGIVVYEMLSGTHPFLREEMTDTITAIMRADPPPLAGAVAGVPPAALRIIERCLEKSPSDRPSSARDIAMFLDASGNTGAFETAAVFGTDAGNVARRVQMRLLAASCGLLLAVVAATWGFVQTSAGGVVDAALEQDLTRDSALVRRVHADRLDRLHLTARLLASSSQLKALFDTKDAPTVREFLISYQQRNPGTPLLVGIGPAGSVLGRTDTETAAASGLEDWLAAVVAKEGEPTVVAVGGHPYHAASAEASAGGIPFGHVIAAAPIDEQFVRMIGEATGDQAVLVSGSTILASTLTDEGAAKSLASARQSGPDRTTTIDIGARRFAAREVQLTQEPPVSVVIARSRDDALAPYRRIQSGLVTIGLVGVAVALLASVWLYRVITRRARIGGS